MHHLKLILGMFLVLSLAVSACGGGGATEEGPAAGGGDTTTGGGGGAPAATATEAALQEDVPILEGATDLKITSGGAVINYQVESTVAEATQFYQEQLAALGWEQLNKKDSGFGDSITLLRSKPEQNISVTLQSIAGSTSVRVQITLTPK